MSKEIRINNIIKTAFKDKADTLNTKKAVEAKLRIEIQNLNQLEEYFGKLKEQIINNTEKLMKEDKTPHAESKAHSNLRVVDELNDMDELLHQTQMNLKDQGAKLLNAITKLRAWYIQD